MAAVRWEGHDRHIMGEGEGWLLCAGKDMTGTLWERERVAAVRWEGHDRHIMGEGEGWLLCAGKDMTDTLWERARGGCCALGRT